MCGRAYSTITEEELDALYWSEKRKRKPFGDLKPNYNISPTQMVPVVFEEDGKREISRMRWGLIPFWAPDIKSASKYSLINAKGEEIEEKRTYKVPFEKRRCIVPLSGFFEWKRSEEKSGESKKQPFAIHLKDQPIMSVAGVWEKWTPPNKKEEPIYSFSVITCAANSFMKKIHNRMPVILDKKDEAAWLDSTNHNVKTLKDFIKPCPSSLLEAYKVSTLVNSPRNNRPELLEPIN